MTKKHILHEYSVRGHEFMISETSLDVGSKSPQIFSIESAGKLSYDNISSASLDTLLEQIDTHLPAWIERTRSQGHAVIGYDPRAPITRLPD